MILSSEELSRYFRPRSFGAAERNRAHRIVGDLERATGLILIADFDLLEDESAATVQLYFARAAPETGEIDALGFLVNAFVPIAGYCPARVAAGSRAMRLADVGMLPSPEWSDARDRLTARLRAHDVRVPGRAEWLEKLPLSDEVPEAFRGRAQYLALLW